MTEVGGSQAKMSIPRVPPRSVGPPLHYWNRISEITRISYDDGGRPRALLVKAGPVTAATGLGGSGLGQDGDPLMNVSDIPVANVAAD